MSRAVNAIVIGIAVFVLLTGSIWYVMVAREPNRIKATVDREWNSETGDRFHAVVTFENPYDYDVTFHRYDYRFLVNGKEWAGGGDQPAQLLKAHEKTRVPLTINFSAEAISGWFKDHVANNEESTVQLRGEAIFSLSDRNKTVPFGYRERFSTNILDSMVENEGCEDAPGVCLEGAEGRWVEKDNAAVLQLDADLHNPTSERADLGNSSLSIVWAGIEVGRADTHGGTIDPSDNTRAEYLIFFEHARLLQWWAAHTRACEESKAGAVLNLEIEYEPVTEPEESPSESPTPARTSATSHPTNTTSTEPTPTGSPSSTPTQSPSGTPTQTTGPAPTTTSGAPPPTNTTYETAYRFAHADPARPIAFELDPVRTEFVCTHE